MAISDVSLTTGMRSNLLSLQATVSLLDRTQERLSTGKKVNTAMDNPVSFFAAQSLTSRASIIDSLKDAMGQAVQTIEAADKGITAITTMIEQAKGIAQSAQSASSIYDKITLNNVSGGTPDTVTLTIADSLTAGAIVTVGGVGFTAITTGTATATQFMVDGTADHAVENLRAKIAATTSLSLYTATTAAGVITFSKVDAKYGDPIIVNENDITSSETTSASVAVVDGVRGDNITLNLASGTQVLHAFYNRYLIETDSQSAFWYADPNSNDNAADATRLAALINYNPDVKGAGYAATAKDGVVTLTRSKYDITSSMVTAATSYGVALSSTETSELSTLVTQYNTLRTQLDELAEDAGYKGKNLLEAQTLTVKFEGANLDVVGFNAKTAGLGISAATWTTGGSIDTDITALDNALTKLRTESSKMSGNLSIISVREDFSKNMINTLTEGADKLTLADTNEEGANMLMLQTRQSLSTTALSLSAQAAQSVLQLFG